MAVFIFMKAMIFIVLLCILSVYSEPTLEVEGTAITEGKENIECSCNNSSSSNLLQKATDMQEQIKNKTTVFSKIQHRATHSNEALWASLSLSLMLILLTIGTIKSKMWKDRPAICYMDSQPVRYESNNKKSEILFKTMVKSRARNLIKFTRQRSINQRSMKGQPPDPELNMSAFLQPQDSVDSISKSFLESSSESSYDDYISTSSDEEEQANTFWLNKRTGDLEAGSSHSASQQSLLSRGEQRRNWPVWYKKDSSRIRINSSDSHQSDVPLDSSLVQELERESSSSEEAESETAALIKIG